ncbi:DUF2459 domain-containing protein [Hyphomonas sp.]|uniref:DUF2459 domain-containing protein n=1 Tax=Hyphomonas sp. TaxID=87 RepID=UPI00391B7716
MDILAVLKGGGLMVLALGICAYWYLAAAALSALLPSGGRVQAQAEGEPPAFLCEAPFHTDIALPLNDPLVDWHDLLGGALPRWMPADTYLLVGWGDSVFFTRVLHPEDMTASRALGALAGLNPVAMRIVPVDGRSVEELCHRLEVDREGRAALITRIRETFREDADGLVKTLPTPVPGEILIKAKGRYSMFNTCNQWTAAALGHAGLPRAAFAPFSFSVTKPLNRAAALNGRHTLTEDPPHAPAPVP